jgi:hypothetical protein
MVVRFVLCDFTLCLGVDRWKWNYKFSLHEYRNNPTPYKLNDPLHFLQLPCFYFWTPYQAFLSYAYKVGRSYPAGIFLGHTLNL